MLSFTKDLIIAAVLRTECSGQEWKQGDQLGGP